MATQAEYNNASGYNAAIGNYESAVKKKKSTIKDIDKSLDSAKDTAKANIGHLGALGEQSLNAENTQAGVARDTITSGTAGIKAEIDDMSGFTKAANASGIANVGVQKEGAINVAGQGLGRMQGMFDDQRAEVASTKKTNLRDLGQDVQNSFKAANNFLGTAGASNSSAAGMSSDALRMYGNRNTTAIQNQAASDISKIARGEADAQSLFNEEMSKIEMWASSEINDLNQEMNAQMLRIQEMKVNASKEELAMLNAQEQNILQTKQQRTTQINANAQQAGTTYAEGLMQASINDKSMVNQSNLQLPAYPMPTMMPEASGSGGTPAGTSASSASTSGGGLPTLQEQLALARMAQNPMGMMGLRKGADANGESLLQSIKAHAQPTGAQQNLGWRTQPQQGFLGWPQNTVAQSPTNYWNPSYDYGNEQPNEQPGDLLRL